MTLKSLDDLFHESLRDVYYAEKRLVKTLPKLAKKASNGELSAAFTDHQVETQEHVSRLEQVFKIIEKPARGKTCEAMDGLLEEGNGIIEDAETDAVLDVGLIAAAQAVEHYEIARYGALVEWAKLLGLSKAENLLQATLAEEKTADAKLSKIAARINLFAKSQALEAAKLSHRQSIEN